MQGYVIGAKELVPTGYEVISVEAVSIGITAGLLVPAAGNYTGKPAVRAIISIETDQVRLRIDGGVPTNLIGHLLQVGDFMVVTGAIALSNLRLIKVTNNASVKVTVFHAGPRMA